jgi:hypothetical protein
LVITLAVHPDSNTISEKDLEILVSHDSSFSEIVLLSGWTARVMTKSVTEATGEIPWQSILIATLSQRKNCHERRESPRASHPISLVVALPGL